jgi:hypothetical protein
MSRRYVTSVDFPSFNEFFEWVFLCFLTFSFFYLAQSSPIDVITWYDVDWCVSEWMDVVHLFPAPFRFFLPTSSLCHTFHIPKHLMLSPIRGICQWSLEWWAVALCDAVVGGSMFFTAPFCNSSQISDHPNVHLTFLLHHPASNVLPYVSLGYRFPNFQVHRVFFPAFALSPRNGHLCEVSNVLC